MNSFSTTVNGIDCLCRVFHYRPYVPAKKFGWAENWEEEIPSEFSFTITDARGTPLPFLAAFALEDDATFNRLQDEYEAAVLADKHGKDF